MKTVGAGKLSIFQLRDLAGNLGARDSATPCQKGTGRKDYTCIHFENDSNLLRTTLASAQS